MAQITRPLIALLRKNVKFHWNHQCQEAFQRLKEEVAQPKMLSRPDFNRKFHLQTDASLSGLGAVLFQLDDESNKKIISYSSSTLTPAETKYHVNELEVLAALFGLKKYRPYLQDKPFVLITDSSALYWLEKNKDSKAKLTRWSLLLQEYSFEIQHCSGKDNQLADYLSRHPVNTNHEGAADEERLFPPDTSSPKRLAAMTHDALYDEVKQAQQHSHSLQRDITRWKDLQQNENRTPTEQKFVEMHDVQDNIIYRKHNGDNRLIIPRRRLHKVLHQLHDEAAHPGIDETTRSIQQFYHYNNLQEEVQSYVKNCLICAAVKGRQIQPEAPLKPHTAKAPFEIISIDTMGPYPETRGKNKYIIVVEDLFTKWVEAKAVPKADIREIKKFLEEDLFPRYGSPRYIISDNAATYTSNIYLRMCAAYQIQPYYTAVYYQRENPVERKIQELKKILRALLYHEHHRNNWDQQLSRALFLLRTRKNRATGTTPSEALLGYQLPERGQWKIPEYVRRRREVPHSTARCRRQRLRRQQAAFQRKTYQQNPRPERTFRIGEQVMVREFRSRDPFIPVWSGPHPIVVKKSAEIYEIDKNGFQFQYHVDQIRPAPRGNRVEDADQSDESDNDDERPPVPQPPEQPEIQQRDEIPEPQPSTSTADSQSINQSIPDPDELRRRRRKSRLIIK